MEFKYVLEIAIKSLLCGGIVSFAADSSMNLDNRLISIIIWVIFSMAYGVVVWFCFKNRNADKLQSNDEMKDRLVNMEQLFENMVKSIDALSVESAEMGSKLTELGEKVDTQTEKLTKSNETIAAKNTELCGRLAETAATEGNAVRDSLAEMGGKLGVLEDLKFSTDAVCIKLKDLADMFETECDNTQSIESAMSAIKKSMKEYQTAAESLSKELALYNANYKDNIDNISREMNAVARNLCDNYKMMKLIGDRYV